MGLVGFHVLLVCSLNSVVAFWANTPSNAIMLHEEINENLLNVSKPIRTGTIDIAIVNRSAQDHGRPDKTC